LALVVPHHNLVRSTRQDFLEQIARQRLITRKIILIGPDHFSTNQKQINISDQNWQLSTGVIEFFDLNLNLTVNNKLVKKDHAIHNPLPDLKIYFPQAKIYPILIGQQVDPSLLDSLVSQLSQICSYDCLLVTSVDFSHYLPATLAEVHDAFTLNQLAHLDVGKIIKSEVDSPQSLYFLTKYAQLKNARHWNLFAHTNSGYLAQNPDTETTTHVVGSYSSNFPLFTRHPQSTTTSVTTPYLLERSLNQHTLGDRFFYGIDSFSVDPSVNFVVSTITTPTQTITTYLPLADNNFLRGQEKLERIRLFFDSIADSRQITKDYLWGKLIYDRK